MKSVLTPMILTPRHGNLITLAEELVVRRAREVAHPGAHRPLQLASHLRVRLAGEPAAHVPVRCPAVVDRPFVVRKACGPGTVGVGRRTARAGLDPVLLGLEARRLLE